MDITLRRVYDDPVPGERRILVERLWPRGLTKEKAAVDLWLKEVSPSQDLRRWFSHDPDKWPEFQQRYRAELDANPGALAKLRDELAQGPVTFVYAAKDLEHNSARLLREYVLDRFRS